MFHLIMIQQNYKTVKDLTANLTINEKELEKSMFEILSSVSYTGSKHEPEIKGTYNNMPLVKGSDFTVTYQDNVEQGMAKAIVSGINNYKGTVTLEFEIGDSDLVKVKKIREELETTYGTVLSGELNNLPETLPVNNANGSVNTWMSSTTAISVDANGNVNAIFTAEAQAVTLYAIITSGDAAEYVSFTFSLASKVKLVDNETQIEIENADSGTTIEVKQLTEEEKGAITINENDQLLAAYDINLMDLESQIVQPSGTVTVKLPVPAGADTSKLTVYHVQEDGTLENMNATIVDGYLVFTTTHFSTYIITTEKVEKEIVSGVWTLVTDATTLKAGDKIILVSVDNKKINAAMGTGKFLTAIDATFANNVLKNPTEGIYEILLGGKTGAWTLTTSEGILGTNAAKALNCKGTGTTTWTIEIDGDGNATISSTNAEYGKILYNTGSPRFLNYTSNPSKSMVLPQIYRFELGSQGGDEPTPVTSYTVTFDVNGGNETIADQTVESGKLVSKPEDPTKEGHTFAGWLLNGEEYDFNTPVTGNITLTASWTENSQGGDEPTPSGNFELLDDISKLVISSKIIIVNKDATMALGTNQKTNNREAVAVELVNGVIVPGSTVQIIEIVAGTKEGTFAFKVDGGYLYAAGNAKKANYLRTEETLSDNSSWKIEIIDGVLSIVAQGTNTINVLKYNKSSNLFSCYSSGQEDVSIYIQSSTN